MWSTLNQLEVKDIVAALALLVAGFSFLVSCLTYVRYSDRAQLAREQTGRLRIVAGVAIVIWDQMQVLVAAQVGKYEVDSYLIHAYLVMCGRLEAALDSAIGSGLLESVVGNKPNALQMHTAFRSELANLANRAKQNDDIPVSDLTKQHLVFGMVRLMDTIISLRDDAFPLHVRQSVEQNIGRLRDQAWTYLVSQRPGAQD